MKLLTSHSSDHIAVRKHDALRITRGPRRVAYGVELGRSNSTNMNTTVCTARVSSHDDTDTH